MATASVYEFDAIGIDGTSVSLDTYRGRVMLIVNTASACGFTPQFAGMESLWQRYREQGLTILGFPSNEFGGQDPGTDKEISTFCTLEYHVSFPMMSKGKVNGSDAQPLWQWLTREAPGLLGTTAVKWNFTKFLIAKDGRVVKRYAPTATPESIEGDIAKELAR